MSCRAIVGKSAIGNDRTARIMDFPGSGNVASADDEHIASGLDGRRCTASEIVQISGGDEIAVLIPNLPRPSIRKRLTRSVDENIIVGKNDGT
jgi:hypothetical protein